MIQATIAKQQHYNLAHVAQTWPLFILTNRWVIQATIAKQQHYHLAHVAQTWP